MDRLQRRILPDENDRYILCQNINYKPLDSSRSKAISEFMQVCTAQTQRGNPPYALLETKTSDPQAAHLSLPDLLVITQPTFLRIFQNSNFLM
jgi:hypothetical protein